MLQILVYIGLFLSASSCSSSNIDPLYFTLVSKDLPRLGLAFGHIQSRLSGVLQFEKGLWTFNSCKQIYSLPCNSVLLLIYTHTQLQYCMCVFDPTVKGLYLRISLLLLDVCFNRCGVFHLLQCSTLIVICVYFSFNIIN